MVTDCLGPDGTCFRVCPSTSALANRIVSPSERLAAGKLQPQSMPRLAMALLRAIRHASIPDQASAQRVGRDDQACGPEL